MLAEVDGRRGGTCEAAGWPVLHVQYHHRRPYRMGGRQADDGLQNTAANIVGLCPRHHAWAHAHGPGDRHGLIVAEGFDPRDIPVIVDPRIGPCGV